MDVDTDIDIDVDVVNIDYWRILDAPTPVRGNNPPGNDPQGFSLRGLNPPGVTILRG